MTPLPPVPREPAHDAVVLAQVLDALAVHDGAPDETRDDEAASRPRPSEVDDLIAAAHSELSRERPLSASAPVLGGGVVQRLLELRLHPRRSLPPADPASSQVDHTL